MNVLRRFAGSLIAESLAGRMLIRRSLVAGSLFASLAGSAWGYSLPDGLYVDDDNSPYTVTGTHRRLKVWVEDTGHLLVGSETHAGHLTSVGTLYSSGNLTVNAGSTLHVKVENDVHGDPFAADLFLDAQRDGWHFSSFTLAGTVLVDERTRVQHANVSILPGGLLTTQSLTVDQNSVFTSAGAVHVTDAVTLKAGELHVTGGTFQAGKIDVVTHTLLYDKPHLIDFTVDAGATVTTDHLLMNSDSPTQRGAHGALSGTVNARWFEVRDWSSTTVDGLVQADNADVSGGLHVTADGVVTVDGEFRQHARVIDPHVGSQDLNVTTLDGQLNANAFLMDGGVFHLNGTLDVAADAVISGGRANFDGQATVGGLLTVDGAAARLAVLGGQLQAGSLALTGQGSVTVASGALLDAGATTVDGAGSTLALRHGGQWTGATLAVTNGGATTIVGETTLTGAATVDGTGSTLTVTREVPDARGSFAAGSLALTDGGTATTHGTTTVSGAATVDGTGSTLEVKDGTFDADSLALSNGGTVTTGGATTVAGAATVNGSGSQLDVKSGTLHAGSLALSDGGAVTTRSATTVDGATTVQGAGSTLEVKDGTFDADSLALSNGGTATTDGTVAVHSAATVDGIGSVLHVTGGTFAADSLALSNGGTATNAADMSVDGATTVDGAGSALSLNGGRFNTGSLALNGGGTATTQAETTVSGAATVDGAGSSLNVTGNTFHAGSLALSNGGTAATAAAATIAGALTVQDAGSTLGVNDGGAATAKELTVDAGGAATVHAGGRLHATTSATLGGGVGGGTLTVAGDADLGATTVRQNGALVADGTVDAAHVDLSGGSADVSAGGSLSADSVAVTDGSVLTVDAAATGQPAGSLHVNGAVTLGDGTSAGTLILDGQGATGDLTISPSGTLAVGGTLNGRDVTVSGAGDLTVAAGGRLTGRTLRRNAGTGAATLGGTALFRETHLSGGLLSVVGSGENALGTTTVTDGTLNVTGLATTHGFDGGRLQTLTIDGAGGAVVDPTGRLVGGAIAVKDGTLSAGTGAVLAGLAPLDPLADLAAGTVFGHSLVTTGGDAALGAIAVNAGGRLAVGGGVVESDALLGSTGPLETLTIAGGGIANVTGGTLRVGDATLAGLSGATAGLIVGGGTVEANSLTLTDRSVARLTGGGALVTVTEAVVGRGPAVALSVAAGSELHADRLDLADGAQMTVDGTGAPGGSGFGLDVKGVNVGGSDAVEIRSGAGLTVNGVVRVHGKTDLDQGTLTLLAPGARFETTALDARNAAVVNVHAGTTLVADRVDLLDHDSQLNVADGGTVNAGQVNFAAGSQLTVQRGTTLSSSTRTTITGSHGDDETEARLNGTFVTPGLTLEHGSTLRGAGLLVADGAGPDGGFLVQGRLAPGNSPGVLRVLGDTVFDPTAVLDLELVAKAPGATPVAGSDYDQVAVNGAVTLDGPAVEVSRYLPPGHAAHAFAPGTTYDVITATDGLSVLAPVTVNDPFAELRFAQLIGRRSFSLVAARDVSYRGLGETFNQRAVGAGLDAVRTASVLNEIGGLRDALDTLPSDAAVAAALGDLSGEIYGSQLTALNRSSGQFFDALGAREARSLPGCGACGPQADGGLTGWIDARGADGRVSGDGNGSAVRFGHMGGGAGLSRTFGGDGGACLGVSAFYGYESLTTRTENDDASVTDAVHRVGGSLRASAGRFYGRLAAFGGAFDAEARRRVVVPNPLFPLDDRLAADYRGSLAGADAEAGLLFGDAGAHLMPVVGLRYAHVGRDSFVESGGITALDVQRSELDELRFRLGVRGRRALGPVAGLPIAATLGLFYDRDLSAASVGDFDAALRAAPGSTFTARGTDFGRDRIALSPGLTLGDGPVQFSAGYQAGLSSEAVFHAGDARLEFCF